MTDGPEKPTFGGLLRYFRGQAINRKSGKPLSQEQLGTLLTDKIGLIITRNKVNNWETNKNSPHAQRERDLLIAIVQVLQKYKGVKTLEEANQLLQAGNYLPLTNQEVERIDPTWNQPIISPKGDEDLAMHPPAVSQDNKEPIEVGVTKHAQTSTQKSVLPLSDQPIPEPMQVPRSQLPGKSYRELVGRDILVGNALAALRDPAGKWISAVDGMGGIGKTALAREVADRCISERLFDIVVWDQAPKESQGLPKTDGDNVGTMTFETVLDSIARQLGALDVPRLKKTEKEMRVKGLLQFQRVLIVLDNLETAKESQNEIARQLLPLLNPSKALMTSRHRFQGDVFSVHLAGLEEDGALRFIRQEAEEKNIQAVSSAGVSELKQIAETTGGSPLALKLVVGQLGHLPLGVVLGQLSKIKLPKGDSDKNDYVRFYKQIFLPSWKLVSEDGQKLLISMSHFASGIGGTYDAVKATSDLSDETLISRIDELWRLSFLETGESPNLKKVRYYLHALTQYFVLSDIVKVL